MASDFYRNRSCRNGLTAYCKACSADRSREHRAKNPGALKEQKKRYYEANRSRLLAKQEAYRRSNPEYQKQWRESNPVRRRSYKAARRALVHGTQVEPVDYKLIFEIHEGICGICLEPTDPDDYHMDHIVPLARGGSHTWDNLQPSQPRCNQSKGARLGVDKTVDTTPEPE